MEWLFNLLGWEFKVGPEDLKPLAPYFVPLGVKVDFSVAGWVEVANTAKRLDKIQEEVKRVCGMEKIPSHDVESLVGVCQFAESQTSGRSGALAFRRVRRALSAYNGRDHDELQDALKELAVHSATAAPRWLRLRHSERPVLIFMDAAAEAAGVTIGGVLFDPETKLYQYFGTKLDSVTIEPWTAEGKDQVIC